MTGSEAKPVIWRSPLVIGVAVVVVSSLAVALPGFVEDWVGSSGHLRWDYRPLILPLIWLIPMAGICGLDMLLERRLKLHTGLRLATMLIGALVLLLISVTIDASVYREDNELRYQKLIDSTLLFAALCYALWKSGRTAFHHAVTLAVGIPLVFLIARLKPETENVDTHFRLLILRLDVLVNLNKTALLPAAMLSLGGLAILAWRRLSDPPARWFRTFALLSFSASIGIFVWLPPPAGEPMLVAMGTNPAIWSVCRSATDGMFIAVTRSDNHDGTWVIRSWKPGDRVWRIHGRNVMLDASVSPIDDPDGNLLASQCSLDWTERPSPIRKLLGLPARCGHTQLAPAMKGSGAMTTECTLPVPEQLKTTNLSIQKFRISPVNSDLFTVLGADGATILASDNPAAIWVNTLRRNSRRIEPVLLREYDALLYTYLSGDGKTGLLYQFDPKAGLGMVMYAGLPPVQWTETGVILLRNSATTGGTLQELIQLDLLAHTKQIWLQNRTTTNIFLSGYPVYDLPEAQKLPFQLIPKYVAVGFASSASGKRPIPRSRQRSAR